MQTILYQVNCAFGLESVVKRELADLGYEARGDTAGRVLFSGPLDAIARCQIWLRAGDRLKLILGKFPAPDFDALFEGVQQLAWEELIPAAGQFPVTARTHKSQLTSLPAIQRTVKKAVVLRLQSGHRTAHLEETAGLYAIEVELLGDQATLTLDATGPSLHKRGYRRLNVQAPLKETMAAAMVLLSSWRHERPLLDPFCGSGTICLEAALIGRNLAPGAHRQFSADEWPLLSQTIWRNAREEAADLAKRNRPLEIVGTDRDPSAIKLAAFHRGALGFHKGITFLERSFSDIEPHGEYGSLITNPPYGERLGEIDEAHALFREFPRVLRRFPTWSHHILAPSEGFESLMGQTATRRRKLYNGRLECTFFQFYGPRPPRPQKVEGAAPPTKESASVEVLGISEEQPSKQERSTAGVQAPDAAENAFLAELPQKAAGKKERPPSSPGQPAFGGISPRGLEQAKLFAARLSKTARHLRRWPSRQDIHCFRLYDRDVPEIPLCVDRYGDYLHIAEYDRPHERTAAEHADWLDLMTETAAKTLELPLDHVFLKRRERQRGDNQYQRVAHAGKTAIVMEGGLKFEVNLSDYLDVGLFLDHRQTRRMVRDVARGKRFLNLFCYTGAFTVYAADGGAASTVSVDLNANYLDWAHRNLQLNKLWSGKHQLVRADIRQFLAELPPQEKFDLVVCDPPTFSNSKRTPDFFDVQRDHADMLLVIGSHLSEQGTIYFSTNFRRFKMEELPGLYVREISSQTVPPDFRNQRIHRCWKITHAKEES